MYEAFYGLNEKPFSLQPDPTYLYMGKRHAFAYSVLEYGVGQGAGVTVITGEVGCGKTTLLSHLLNRLDEDVTAGFISNMPPETDELLRWVLWAFGQPYDHVHKVGLFDQLQQFLIGEYATGRRAVLIVDEAQNLSAAMLEELRMLSNINAEKGQLLQLVLVGQPQLQTLLGRPELLQFVQRVAADFHLPRLETVEVAKYILHRLELAGRSTSVVDMAAVRESSLFDAAAVKRIAQVSQGVPRTINLLCDMALVYGFSAGAERVSRDIVDEVIADKARYGVFRQSEGQEAGDAQPEPKVISNKPLEAEKGKLLFSKYSGEKDRS